MEFDWHIPPSDKFSFENQFNKLKKVQDSLTFLQLEPVLSSSRISEPDILHIWNLVNIKGESGINQDQFIYFMHILMSRRRGRALPSGIPLEIKELFLKDIPKDKGPYVRPNDNSRDVGSLVSKDTQELKDELTRLQVELERIQPDSQLKETAEDLKLTRQELKELLDYKIKQASLIERDRDSAKSFFESKSNQSHSIHIEDSQLKELLAQLEQEKLILEKRMQELTSSSFTD